MGARIVEVEQHGVTADRVERAGCELRDRLYAALDQPELDAGVGRVPAGEVEHRARRIQDGEAVYPSAASGTAIAPDPPPTSSTVAGGGGRDSPSRSNTKAARTRPRVVV